jgi:DNA-binding CsgD family transcriptional regulator
MVMSGGLLGREAEMERLTSLLDGVALQGGALALVGDPGIGKSALLANAAEQAVERGMTVLKTSGVQSETNLPFAGLAQLLHPVAGSIDRLPDSQRIAILAAVGSIDAVVGDFFAVALATMNLLRDQAAETPLLVVAEDVHWLDVATLDVLAFVARRVEDDPLLILASSRTRFADAMAEAPFEVVELGRLDETAAGLLIAVHAPDLQAHLYERLVTEAAGNPLAIVELAIAWRDLPPATQLDALVPVTAKVEQAFAGRLRTLPALSRTVLLIAALSDGELVSDIMAAAGVLAGALPGHAELSAAVEARLIEVDGPNLKFRHPLVRSVVYQAATLTERHLAHSALAQVLDDERAVWHRAAATLLPDEDIAVQLERSAVAAKRRGSIAVAVTAFERSADLSPDAGERGRRTLYAAELAFEATRNDVARRLIEQAQHLPLGALDRARADWARQQLQEDLFHDIARMAVAVEAIERIGAAGDVGRALDALEMLCTLGSTAFDDSLRALIIAAAERQQADKTDPRLIFIVGFNAPLEYNELILQRVNEAVHGSAKEPDDLRRLGAAANYRGDAQLGLSLLRQSLAGLRAQGRFVALKSGLVSCLSAAWTTGQWDLVIELAGEIQRLTVQLDHPMDLIGTMYVALVGAARGDAEPAEKLGREMEQWGHRNAVWQVELVALTVRGYAAVAEGRYEEGYRHFRAGVGPDRPRNMVPWQRVIPAMCDAAVQSGHADEAREIVNWMAAVPGGDSPILRNSVAYGRAVLSEGADAEHLFEVALLSSALESSFTHARLLLAHGRWLRRQRRANDARQSLRRARDIFDDLGAKPWGEQTRQQLRASGEHSQPPRQNMVGRLTPQELEIARLAAQGMTNREIGQRLYLSPRTVGAHLYRIFPKLDITSRRELSATLPATDQRTDLIP